MSVAHDPPASDERQTWYFTFGTARRYVLIHNATWAEARERMVNGHGRQWAFQYDEAEWNRDGISQAERYGLTELP